MASDGQYIDTDCKLLLHMDGSDASTVFTDSELNTPKTITASGNAQIDTAQSKFGGASGLFDGTSDYLTAVNSDDFNLGSGDFTIDFWVRLTDVTTTNKFNRFVGQWNNAGSIDRGWSTLWGVTSGGAKQLWFQYTTNGTTVVSIVQTWAPSADTWYHVAYVRSGNNLYFFIDGTEIGTTTDVTGITIHDSSDVLTIGSLHSDTSWLQTIGGWIDELRIVKGTAVWTSNFTPPTSEYTSAPTVTINYLKGRIRNRSDFSGVSLG